MGSHYRSFEPIDKEERLKKYFKVIRMASGFTTSEFANKIGCTRQLINALEAGKLRITYATFLGVEGIVLNSTSSFLQDLWDILIDNDRYTKDFRDLVYGWGNIVAGALAYGVITQNEADSKWNTIIDEL